MDKEVEKDSEIASVVVTALATVNRIWKRQMKLAHTNAVGDAIGNDQLPTLTKLSFYLAPSINIENYCTDSSKSQRYTGQYDPVGITGLSTPDDSTDDRILYKHSTGTIYFQYHEGKFTFTTEPIEPDSALNQFNENALSKFQKFRNETFSFWCKIFFM